MPNLLQKLITHYQPECRNIIVQPEICSWFWSEEQTWCYLTQELQR